MGIKTFIIKLEAFLKEKYPFIDASFYCSRRKKIAHLGLKKALRDYRDYMKFIKDIRIFFFLTVYRNNKFEFVNPYLNNSVKWKFDYVIFRKRNFDSK